MDFEPLPPDPHNPAAADNQQHKLDAGADNAVHHDPAAVNNQQRKLDAGAGSSVNHDYAREAGADIAGAQGNPESGADNMNEELARELAAIPAGHGELVAAMGANRVGEIAGRRNIWLFEFRNIACIDALKLAYTEEGGDEDEYYAIVEDKTDIKRSQAAEIIQFRVGSPESLKRIWLEVQGRELQAKMTGKRPKYPSRDGMIKLISGRKKKKTTPKSNQTVEKLSAENIRQFDEIRELKATIASRDTELATEQARREAAEAEAASLRSALVSDRDYDEAERGRRRRRKGDPDPALVQHILDMRERRYQ